MNQEKKLHQLHLCWRCKGFLHVRLIEMNGNYTAHLCAHCCNDWEIYARNHELVIKLEELNVAICVLECQTCADAQDRSYCIGEALKQQREVLNDLFFMAKAWIEAGKQIEEIPKEVGK